MDSGEVVLKISSETTQRPSLPAPILLRPSPAMNKYCPTPHRSLRSSPTTDNLRRRSVARSPFQKPKSRFAEPSIPRIQVIDEDEDDEIFKIQPELEESFRKTKIFIFIEWIAFACVMGVFLASLTLDKMQDLMVWKLKIWKWCVLIMVVVFVPLMTKLLIHVLIYLIENNFLFKNKVVFFIVGVKKNVQAIIWLSSVLLTWVLLINHGVERSKRASKILNYVSKTLVSLLIGSILWLVKTVMAKLLVIYFLRAKFFDRIQESLFHQYILRTLSGPPLMEMPERRRQEYKEEEMIDVHELQKMKQSDVYAWTMEWLITAITTSSLYTMTVKNTLDDDLEDQSTTNPLQKNKNKNDITYEWEAKDAASKIFSNVARPGSEYIDKDDLLRFLNKSMADNGLTLFEGAAVTGMFKKAALSNWVVDVYHERNSLKFSLIDTRKVVKQLSNLITAVLVVGIIFLWLLVLGIATVQVFVFISSVILGVAFMCGYTAKTILESVIFVFVRHPFDVGDRCVIEGVQMVVEEMNLLTTVFLRYDNEKIDYPNSVLATKPINNLKRSPDKGDAINFTVDVSTSAQSIEALKGRIKRYIEDKPNHWNPRHLVVVKEIEDLSNMKMALYITHTMNYQNFWESDERRSELIIALKNEFEDLSIKYYILPQKIHRRE